jgi:hypothetical protein
MRLRKDESKAPSQPGFEILGLMGVDGSMTLRLAGRVVCVKFSNLTMASGGLAGEPPVSVAAVAAG